VGGMNKAAGQLNTTTSLPRTQYKILFAAASLAGLSMIGVPGWFGFIAKEETYHALSSYNIVAFGLCVAINVLMVVAALLVAYQPFQLKSKPSNKLKSLSLALTVPPLILGMLGLLAGLT